jgi:hypothetical protein
MSLLRLLTAGKTLIGLKRPESRYQLPGARALPTFGSKKNPFRATVFPDKAELAEPNEDSGAPGTAPESPQERASALPSKDTTGDSSPTATETVQEAKEHSKGQAPSRRTSAIGAFLLWRRAKKTNTQGGHKGRPLVQAELSLETVKVVRNDLSESDLEVVRVARKPAAAEKLFSSAVPQPQAVAPEWSTTDEQLLSAAKP